MTPEDFEKLVDAYGRDEWHYGNTPDFSNKRELAMGHKAQLISAIRSLYAERDALQARVEAAETILRPMYECDPVIRVWFGDPAFTPAVLSQRETSKWPVPPKDKYTDSRSLEQIADTQAAIHALREAGACTCAHTGPDYCKVHSP